MSLTKNVAMAVVSTFFLLGTAYGEPSKPIAQGMRTPASVFDVFLFYLYMEEKCPQLNPCMNNIKYDFANNTIIMRYFTEAPELLKQFSADDKIIKEELIKRLKLVEPPIWSVPIRNKWATKDFDEEKFREEVANRTVIVLFTWIKNTMYSVTRDHQGEIDYTKEDHSKAHTNPKTEEIK